MAPGSDSKFILGFAKRFPTLETYIEKAATEAQLRLVKVEEFKYSELNIQNLLIRDDTERVYIHTYGHFTQIWSQSVLLFIWKNQLYYIIVKCTGTDRAIKKSKI